MEEVPSSPAPVALRGRTLDRTLCHLRRSTGELCDPDSAPVALIGYEPPSSSAGRARERDRQMAFAEAFARAERTPVSSEAPQSLRGQALEQALVAAREREAAPSSHVRRRS